MELCWHFRKFDFMKFRRRVPARLVTGWSNWLRRRPQGQRHRDVMAADIASAICLALKLDVPPGRFLYYENEAAPEQEELSQGQIDANVLWAMKNQPKNRAINKKG